MDIRYVSTTCPYCGTGCGFNLVVRDGRVFDVAHWQRAPVNGGKLCPKGRYAHEFINSPDRLTKPLIKKEGRFVEATWDEAYDLIAERFGSYKPDEMACLSSARASNEENYLMQKFARVVLKTPHIDHCARLCHASTVAGLAAVFGSGAMTNSIQDISESKCVFVLGSNTFEQHPLIARSIIRARQGGAKVIVADPRYTPTAQQADLYMPFVSGTDVAILNGLMQEIIRNGREDKEFIAQRTKDYEKLKEVVMKEDYSLENVSQVSGIPVESLRTAAEWIAGAEVATLIYSMGITQHTTGVDNVKSTANLMMLTGNLGKPGGGVNPLRGQNNVQGACDMGCLPNVFSGYQKVTDEEARKKMMEAWGVDDIAEARVGYTVTEMMNVLTDNPSEIRAMYIMGENPMLSDPDIQHVEEGLRNLEFLVVQDIFLTETAEFADVVLPAACYAEKDGTQTNTERRVQRWKKAQDPPGEAKPDWQIICELGAWMGYEEQFTYKSPEEVFNEVAAVTPSYHGISYSRLDPDGLHWPCPTAEHPGTPILHREKFAMPDGLGVFSAIEWKPPAEVPDAEYPFVLTTGRVIWQWHTGTMTRRSWSLEKEAPIGWIEINTEDAKELGIKDQEVVRASTRRGSIDIPARVTPEIVKGVMFIPFHYKEHPANRLTHNALDPIARIPEFKACAVKVEKIAEA
ncbi:formate dehydrogenase subunit alpha [Methanoculleus bourgensis]|jgi:formate dehydrogenase major subunit|uniref:Formate dehydrogenase subunit alpha n=1 Tax=Methanoculleus bourgensis TaxID=83986 RepID=A0A0X3BK61_9EURY|nr:formate dehydrogenase subunit alpha [Methanoculleus bourgensis]MBT0732998.1 formate dehydrogenase subunit alpha [Methanoculleus bourgensis]MDD3372582.1 formate dehydrogenase subunit alpha [Methanoculleus bourgensis]NMA87637.1 formate dehydrogenase subunit alpha [Methanoculleus bourgensis]NQS77214.1 formate dehydrogenase subunit alpha [Methanoculleus bourgensis]CVK32319.1 Formate dehydrogenase subunit alpha [Methanoculleus bourgensis]